MEKEKRIARITVQKRRYSGFLSNGMTLKDYGREFFDELAKIYNGNIIGNYKVLETKNESQ